MIEAGVPGWLYGLRGRRYVIAEGIEVDEVRLDVARHDPVTQRLDKSHVRLSRDRLRVKPIVTHYTWPSELDLMARIAGLELSGTASRSATLDLKQTSHQRPQA